MKKTILVVCMYVFTLTACKKESVPEPVVPQPFIDFALQVGYNIHSTSITVDNSGNIYILGNFGNQAKVGSTFSFKNSSGTFVAKYATSGNLLWVRELGNSYLDPVAIDVDATGNVYAVCNFYQTATFDSVVLEIKSDRNVCIVKYSNNGDFQWAKKVGDNTTEGTSMAVDGAGNTYITGDIVDDSWFGTTKLVPKGTSDIFIASYDTDGNLRWVTQAGGESGTDVATSIAINSLGNISVTGSFLGVYHFDSISITSNHADTFVATYTSTGKIINAFRTGFAASFQSLDMDEEGNVYVTGVQNATDVFDYPLILAKYTATGSMVWQQKVSTSYGIAHRSVKVDKNKNVYLLGTNFVRKYTPTGTLEWLTTKNTGQQLPNGGVDSRREIDVDTFGNVYITGDFYDVIDTRTKQRSTGAFLWKFK